MKTKKILLSQTLMVALIVCVVSNAIGAPKKVTIAHTNDLHSHFLGFSPTSDYTPATTNDDETVGGYARIATFINNLKKDTDRPVFYFDGGDFSMGTPFHLGVMETGFELNILKAIGMDATTLGNHEFDFRPGGLAKMVNAALLRGDIPIITSANLAFSSTSANDDSLKKLFDEKVIKNYSVIEKQGVKIGFYGITGKDALKVAPNKAPVTYIETNEIAQKIVDHLRQVEKVDLVVQLSHSGLWKNKSISEDEITAKQVNGIDVIVSGHTRDKKIKPLMINDTLIVHAGMYGQYVGVLDLEVDNGKVTLLNYSLNTIDDKIVGDSKVHQKITDYIGYIDKKHLAKEGFSFYQTVAETKFDLLRQKTESTVGNLVADSILWRVNQLQYNPEDPSSRAVAALEVNGVIRDDLLKGKSGHLSVADIFTVFPLGIGMDDTLGYPLLSFYITGAEFKDSLEVMASLAPIKNPNFNLQISGLRFTYNPLRVPLDKVTKIELQQLDGSFKELDYSRSNKTLYRVAANYYNTSLLGLIDHFTKGILKLQPKYKNGEPITDLSTVLVDNNPEIEGLQESKEWIGLIKYMQQFKDIDGNGIPDVPMKYQSIENRSFSEASLNPVKYFSNANGVTFSVLGIVIGIFVLLILFMRFVFNKIKFFYR